MKFDKKKIKLDKWDWAWIILDILIIILYSYLGIVEQNASLWHKIMYQTLVALGGINFGFTLDGAIVSK